MTEAELKAMAEEIVARIQADRKTVGSRRADAQTRSGRQQTVIRGALALAAAPVAPAASPLADIAWRGPNVMKAAWTPAAGARRVADFVDHTLLKAEATRAEILKLCAEARQHRFAAVCVNAGWVEICVEALKGAEVAVATVCGFPLGATTSRTKAAEASEAVSKGAAEVDMVIALGRARGGEWAYVEDDIRAVVEASRPAIVKVIIESAALTTEEIVKASAIAKEAGAHFVKTSTGFHASGGATAEAVRLMRLVVGDDLGVKASGGVRDCATALAMIAAGACRIGTSSGVGFVTCLGPGPLPLAELLVQPNAHVPACTSGTCQPAGGGQPY